MSKADLTKACMFFVGGNDVKSNNDSAGMDKAGGCIADWWQGANGVNGKKPGDVGYDLAAQTAMGKLMNTDGSAKYTDSGATYSQSPLSGTRVNAAAPGINQFTGAEVGMIAYCTYLGAGFSGPMSGTGLYEIIAVDPSGDWFDINDTYSSGSAVGALVNVGGAWDSFDNVGQEISASLYTQEIHINKDLTGANKPIANFDFRDYGNGGNKEQNSWLHFIGFNRVPLDITDPLGTYYESIQEVDAVIKAAGTPHTDKWVHWEFSAAVPDTDFLLFYSCENIIFEGFYCSDLTTDGAWKGSSSTYNIIVKHCVGYGVKAPINFWSGVNGILLLDCYFNSTTVNTLNFSSGATGIYVVNCIIHSVVSQAFATVNIDGAAIGNYFYGAYNPFSPMNDTRFLALNNTMAGGDTRGGFRMGGSASLPSNVFSINNIILPENGSSPPYYWLDDESYGYGSLFANNDCVYIPGVGPVPLLQEHPKMTGDGIVGKLLEEDPLIDANYEPANIKTRMGGDGSRDIQNDAIGIGAIQAMNTTALQAAAQSAIDATFTLTGGDVKATLDGEAVKLASDGLDSVVVAEPSGDPDGWSFAKKLLWLCMRFLNKHTSDNFNGIQVYKADDSVSTTQTVTDANGVKTVGKAS